MKSVIYLSTFIDDLYSIATRGATLYQHSAFNSPSFTQLPVRVTAWETYNDITAFTDGVILRNQVNITSSISYANKLYLLREVRRYTSSTYARDIRGFISFAHTLHTLLTVEPDKTYIGTCLNCNASLWAIAEDITVHCPHCDSEWNTIDVKQHMLRSLYNCEYTATISELVTWLKSIGIKISKRSVQRWCQEGRIHTQTIDGRGTMVFRVGDVIRQLKMAQSGC
ncbi:hypothetical protein EJ419_07255 [Alloscardovia theropitheci]|uniref:Uncharacterized protein n=1 Tax=Alloscardovia theropitheci TaxID=2496842 RepID=A0A4R0QYY5_9BIFI|nr:hypothetical protein [Alloscardovia theropitheci]TCD53756.1 hypothetical protein EJ419_07255 [Alloscardovia theropitheci]